MILYPHCNLQLLTGIDITQHFHGDDFRDNLLKELESSLILFMPQSTIGQGNEKAVLKHLAMVNPSVQIPERDYSGKHLSTPDPRKDPPPSFNCEKKIFKKLEGDSKASGIVGQDTFDRLKLQIDAFGLRPLLADGR